MKLRQRLMATALAASMCCSALPTVSVAADKMPFKDVRSNDWYYDAVEYNYENNLMAGTSETTFEPNTVLNRAMIAQVLYNLEGRPSVSHKASEYFTDVRDDAWYANAVAWAKSTDTANGYGDKRFGPEDPLTREQMARVFMAYAEYKDYDISKSTSLDKFSDANQVSDWAQESMRWAVASGLLTGKGNGILDPVGTATRAEVASVMRGFVEKITFADDTDKDGLKDTEEEELKTDPNNPDTDGDGFTDFEEIGLMGTDPLVANDSSKDTDGDGLTDYEEVKTYGTDINAQDSDGDGLTDYEEVKTYETDPMKEDTDGDGLSDGFEVQHGLDPTKSSTDGKIPDGKVKIEQTITDDGISLELRDEKNLTRPTISGKVAGEMEDHIFLAQVAESAVSENRSVIGEPVYIEGEDSYVNGLTLDFDISSYKGEKDNLVICELEDDGTYTPVDTEASNNRLSTKVRGSNTYFVIDVEEFLNALGIDLSKYTAGKATSQAIGNTNDNNEDTTYVEVDPQKEKTLTAQLTKNVNENVKGQADIVFAIDTTGSMSGAINNVVSNISAFANALAENYNVQINYALIDYKDIEDDGENTTNVVTNGSSNWFSTTDDFLGRVKALTTGGGGDSPESAVDALDTARRLDYRSSANKFIILITDADYKIANNYGIASMEEESQLLKEAEINTSVVTSSSYKERYRTVYETTGGLYADISSDFSTTLMSLADLIGENVSNGTWVILKHGYQFVKVTDSTDMDGDGIPTTEELGDKTTVDITPFIKIELEKNGEDISSYDGQTSIDLYDAKSDPTKIDTDDDGINDGEDTAPWTKGLAGGIIGELSIVAAHDKSWNPRETGHGWLEYKSFVNDNINVKDILGGYIADSTKEFKFYSPQAGGKNKDGEEIPVAETYPIKRNGYIALGASGESLKKAISGETSGGILYNCEFTAVNRGYYWKTIVSYGRQITNVQLQKIMNYCAKNNFWNLYSHNCSTVATGAWNTAFPDEIMWAKSSTIYGDFMPSITTVLFDTPEILKKHILQKENADRDHLTTMKAILEEWK